MQTLAESPPTLADPDRIAALQSDLAACLTLFPVLRAQLGHSAAEVEQSVLEACCGLQTIATHAKQSVAEARQTIDQSAGQAGAGQNGTQALLEAVRAIVDREEASSRSTLATVDVMGNLENEMKGVVKNLSEVDHIAKTLRLLGLNATIEASRAGVHGRTFAVVAAETTTLAVQAAKIAKSIQRTVASLGQCISSSLTQLRKTAADLAAGSQANRLQVEDALTNVGNSQQRLQQAAERAHHAGESLAADVANTVVTLQFQDRVNQQVTHVVEALADIEAGLGAYIHDTADADRPQRNWTQQLVSRYTMKAERDIHSATVGGPAGKDAQLGGNVEFF